MNWTPEELQAIVDEHALVLFMKGTPNEGSMRIFKSRCTSDAAIWRALCRSQHSHRPPRYPFGLCMVGFPNHASNICSRRTHWRLRYCLRDVSRRSLQEMFDAGRQ